MKENLKNEKEEINVVLIGEGGVGKSTLANKLIGS